MAHPIAALRLVYLASQLLSHSESLAWADGFPPGRQALEDLGAGERGFLNRESTGVGLASELEGVVRSVQKR